MPDMFARSILKGMLDYLIGERQVHKQEHEKIKASRSLPSINTPTPMPEVKPPKGSGGLPPHWGYAGGSETGGGALS